VNPYTPEESQNVEEPIEKEVANAIYEKLKEFGLKPKFVSAIKNRPNIVCSLKKKGKPVLIFNAHMDTVDVGDRQKWKFDPFRRKLSVKNYLVGELLTQKLHWLRWFMRCKSWRKRKKK